MTRRIAFFLTVVLPSLALSPRAGRAQQAPATARPAARQAAPTTAQKIADALAAAPEAITRGAAVKDWPASEGGALAVLRPGGNGWVCLPTPPGTSTLIRDPMCIDATWEAWVAAYLRKEAPKITQVGYSYMLASNAEGSNTDPFATRAAPGNHWHKIGPHVMVLYPDPKMYEGISTDPANGGPYVMFKGTPYVHVMWPVR